MFVLSKHANAQDEGYHFIPAPDVWYNDVDGVRFGVRLLGEMKGSFKDGPHRLNAGIWLGSKRPDLPISYYFSFTEPLPFISSFGEEGSLQLVSSVRAGYSQHQLWLNKRWQKGFNERRYQEISVFVSQEKMIESEYRLPFHSWSADWKTLTGLRFQTHVFTPLGELETQFNFLHNINEEAGEYSVGNIQLRHTAPLGKGFELNLRGFGGLMSNNAAPEYKYGLAHRPPIEWLNNGLSRAKGTIPEHFFEEGFTHITGGMNLRGYANSMAFPFTKAMSFNTEFVFYNPINALIKNSIIGDFAQLKSYVFHDVGVYSAENAYIFDFPEDINEVSADAGIGFQFSINIPDFLGKDRGFAIRYDMPFWLSDPDGLTAGNVQPGSESPSFKFRGILGIGAVISL